MLSGVGACPKSVVSRMRALGCCSCFADLVSLAGLDASACGCRAITHRGDKEGVVAAHGFFQAKGGAVFPSGVGRGALLDATVVDGLHARGAEPVFKALADAFGEDFDATQMADVQQPLQKRAVSQAGTKIAGGERPSSVWAMLARRHRVLKRGKRALALAERLSGAIPWSFRARRRKCLSSLDSVKVRQAVSLWKSQITIFAAWGLRVRKSSLREG